MNLDKIIIVFCILWSTTLLGQVADADADKPRHAGSENAEIVRNLFGGATNLEVLSLAPAQSITANTPADAAAKEKLQDWVIIGRSSLTDAETIERLKSALVFGIRESDGATSPDFKPRHALRFEKSGKPFLIVASFDTLRARIYGPEGILEVETTYFPATVFNEVFSRLGLRQVNSSDLETIAAHNTDPGRLSAMRVDERALEKEKLERPSPTKTKVVQPPLHLGKLNWWDTSNRKFLKWQPSARGYRSLFSSPNPDHP